MDDQVIKDRILQLLHKAAKSVPGGKPLSEKNLVPRPPSLEQLCSAAAICRAPSL